MSTSSDSFDYSTAGPPTPTTSTTLLSSFSPRGFFPSPSSSFTKPSPLTPNPTPSAPSAASLAQRRHLLHLKAVAAASPLKKTLGWPQLISLGIGCTIGAGIFVVTGRVARDQTGPALFLAYIVSGITCLFAALCYAEFAAMSPSAGSAYSYARGTMGEVVGWIIGWDLCLEYGVGAATVAQSWSSHFAQFVQLCGGSLVGSGVDQPFWAYDPNSGAFSVTGAGFDLFAVLITAAVTCVLYKGIKESATFNNVIVAIKLFVVFFVILVGAGFTHSANYEPFMPYGFMGLSFFGNTVWGQVNGNGDPSGVIAGASIVFFAYIGFDAVSCQAEECKRPQIDLPVGIIGSLGISTLLYVAVSLVLVGMVPYSTIDPAVGVSAAFGANGLVWAEYIIDLGALVGMTSVLLVTMMGQPRVMLAMARDGLLPISFFGAIHEKHGTPYKSTILTGVFVSLLSSLVPLSVLVELVSIGTLLAFFIVCISVIVLRRTAPDLPRPFRCPGAPYIPALGALLCLLLMLSLPGSNWYRLGIWLGLGMALYWLWGRNNAKLVREERERKGEEEGDEAGLEMGETELAVMKQVDLPGVKEGEESKDGGEEFPAAKGLRGEDGVRSDVVYSYGKDEEEGASNESETLNRMRASDD